MQPPKSHIEILAPNVMVSGGGPLGGDWAVRVEPA